jgi:FkbM family methyltransferase
MKMEPTGERFIPMQGGEIALEHTHRYFYSLAYASNKTILDIACGEGYGSNLLSEIAFKVYGVDIDESTITHASNKYKKDNLEFLKGSCTSIPLNNKCIDLVVSYETIEHIKEHDQMLLEIKRVLKDDGMLILSTPEVKSYSHTRSSNNPFHLLELTREEFHTLLKKHFSKVYMYGQKLIYASVIEDLENKDSREFNYSYHSSTEKCSKVTGIDSPTYLIAVCSNQDVRHYHSICEASMVNSTLVRDQKKFISTLEQKISSIKESLSWRLTEPLRYLHGLLISNIKVRYNVYNFKIHGDEDHSWFWEKVERGEWEPETFDVFDRFVKKGDLVCDLGGWIGPTVLYAAAKGAHVTAFEPDPTAFRYLQENVRRNRFKNVLCYNSAISTLNGVKKISPFFQSLGDSTSSLLEGDRESNESADVDCITWDTACSKYKFRKIDFIKIDIEGSEFDVVPGMESYFKKNRPVIYLSTHAPYLAEEEREMKLKKLADIIESWGKLETPAGIPLDIRELYSSNTQNNFRSFIIRPL